MIKKVTIGYFLGIVSIYLLCSFYSLNINFFNWDENVRRHFVIGVIIINILTFMCYIFGSIKSNNIEL